MKSLLCMGLAISQAVIVTKGLSNSNVRHAPHLQVKIASSISKGQRRREERHSKARCLCEGCQRPPIICVCEALPEQKLSTRTKILVLQHPNEFRKKTFSTVPIMSLVLDEIQVKRNYKFELDELPIVQEYLDKGQTPLLLYPGDDAISLDHVDDSLQNDVNKVAAAEKLNKIKEDHNLLIVIDGTWFEAQRMAKASPWLFDVCQQVQFTAPASCIYDAVRKEPEGHCLSTLEACAQVLLLLEGAADASNHLIGVLQLMVDIQLYMERKRHDDPRQKGKQLYERNRRRRQIEKTLFERPSARTLDDGAILRSLAMDDATFVNQNWYHRSKRSLQTIEQRLENGLACFGIEKDGQLCAYIVRSEDGTLGMLYVQDDSRRNGYGSTLVQEATRVLRELDKPCVCFIKQGDDAAESLFQSVGWVANENSEKKTTKISKRKWVFPNE